jgi:hypothetical protein
MNLENTMKKTKGSIKENKKEVIIKEKMIVKEKESIENFN